MSSSDLLDGVEPTHVDPTRGAIGATPRTEVALAGAPGSADAPVLTPLGPGFPGFPDIEGASVGDAHAGDGAAPFVGATPGGSAGDPTLHPPACGADPGVPGQPTASYGLHGAQVEPEAGAWLTGPLPRVVPLADVLALTQAPGGAFYVPPYPTAADALEWELAELVNLQAHRDDPAAVAGQFAPSAPASLAAHFPPDFVDTHRALLSDFVQLQSPPFGAIFNLAGHPQYLVRNVNQQHLRRGHGMGPVVSTGRELARMFEMETPGLLHRHALNYLLYKRPELSPPRQARIWMALEVTLYSALAAAWHYKWLCGAPFRYRQRPYEYDRGRQLRVVFDDVVDDGGRRSKCARRSPSCPSPGTPRHPAYPSGHSTYSAAASAILKYFFPDADTGEHLDRLANNIGTARLWAGVHWRSDHAAGVRIGRAVAHRVQQQLEADCIAPLPPAGAPLFPPLPPPPDPAALALAAQGHRTASACDAAHDAVPPQRAAPFPDCPFLIPGGHVG